MTSVSGQENERNLVSAINAVAQGGSFIANIGSMGEYKILGAKNIGGGNPEPKSDIVLHTDKGDLGVSMKKENFDFLESWMDEARFRRKLAEVNMPPEAIDAVIAETKVALAAITQDEAKLLIEERQSFIQIATSGDPSYIFPDKLVKGSAAFEALANSEFWNGKEIKSPYRMKNYYLHLAEVLGDKYKNFIRLVCRGGEENPMPADVVLIADVPPGITDSNKVSDLLSQAFTIDEITEKYASDPSINIRFRMRPVTEVRTTYSTTNRGKYKKGTKMYWDEDLGVSWTVFTVKQRRAAG